MILHSGQVDGVPFLRGDGPEGVLEAALVFDVGVRDETFRTAGVTHLCEHLVMAALGRRAHDLNATVDISSTVFQARGRPDAVAGFLADLCTALGSPPVDRLATEVGVIEAEGSLPVHPAVAEQLFRRFGFRGPGLCGVTLPAPALTDAATARSYVARHFTRDTAALALLGPMPSQLSLPLPAGPRPPRVHGELAVPTPSWFAHSESGTSLSFRVHDAGPAEREAILAVLRIARERALDRLRHEAGQVYEIDFVAVQDGSGCTVCWHADPSPDRAWSVAAHLLEILRDLRDAGPQPREWRHDAEMMRHHLLLPSGIDHVAMSALDLLHGDGPLTGEQRLAQQAALTGDDLRRPLAALDPTLLIGLPPEVRPPAVVLEEYPEASARAVTGEVFRRSAIGGRLGRLPRGARLVVGDEGISLLMPEGPITVTWDGLVGAATDEDGHVAEVIDGDGTVLPFYPECFRHGGRARSLVEAAVPAELRFPQPRDPEGVRG